MGIIAWLLGKTEPKPNVKIWKGRPPYEEVDAIYQTNKCSKHAYYVATKRPRRNGSWCSIGQEVKLSGTGHNPEWAKNLKEFFSGDKRWITFKRDFNNKFDKNAVEVFGIWNNRVSGERIKKRLGFVGAEYSKDIADLMNKSTLIGIPNIFFIGNTNPGLRFRVYYDMDKEDESYNLILKSLLNTDGISATDVATNSGFKKTEIRNWLDKLSKGEKVTKSLMVACSGYRIEKHKQGKNVFYKAIKDDSKIYTAKKTGWSEEDAVNDPMGADVPDYVISEEF